MNARRLWIRWVLANGVGELVGLGAVFVVGFFLFVGHGEPRGAAALAGLAVLVVGLATFEGFVVGLAQWLVLRRPVPALTARSWIVATVVGAVVAWLLGMIPSTLGPAMHGPSAAPPVEPPPLLVFTMAAAMGAVLGVVLAGAQWVVLRRHFEGARIWLLANALAWCAAMPFIFWLVGATIGERQSVDALALLVLGIGFAGAIAGAIHGLFLVRLVSSQRAT